MLLQPLQLHRQLFILLATLRLHGVPILLLLGLLSADAQLADAIDQQVTASVTHLYRVAPIGAAMGKSLGVVDIHLLLSCSHWSSPWATLDLTRAPPVQPNHLTGSRQHRFIPFPATQRTGRVRRPLTILMMLEV